MRKATIFWKVRYWLRGWRFMDAGYQRERRLRFTALTGLHATWAYDRSPDEEEVIAIQARKIRGLEMQLTQQQRGMARKIAKLERRIAELTAE